MLGSASTPLHPAASNGPAGAGIYNYGLVYGALLHMPSARDAAHNLIIKTRQLPLHCIAAASYTNVQFQASMSLEV
jgi:hypothetical protein